MYFDLKILDIIDILNYSKTCCAVNVLIQISLFEHLSQQLCAACFQFRTDDIYRLHCLSKYLLYHHRPPPVSQLCSNPDQHHCLPKTASRLVNNKWNKNLILSSVANLGGVKLCQLRSQPGSWYLTDTNINSRQISCMSRGDQTTTNMCEERQCQELFTYFHFWF